MSATAIASGRATKYRVPMANKILYHVWFLSIIGLANF
jgi:hypothetical protein